MLAAVANSPDVNHLKVIEEHSKALEEIKSMSRKIKGFETRIELGEGYSFTAIILKPSKIEFPGGQYEGELNDLGEPEGEGSLTLTGTARSEIFGGVWKAGVVFKGFGLLLSKDGLTYRGEIAEGIPEGMGEFYRKDGTKKYYGQWRNGSAQGEGTWYSPLTVHVTGTWAGGFLTTDSEHQPKFPVIFKV